MNHKIININTSTVYGLVCPIHNKIFYVGKSEFPKKRLKNHIATAKRGRCENIYLKNKILYLLNNNKIPLLVEIEVCDKSIVEKREIFWIKKYSSTYLENITHNKYKKGKTNNKSKGMAKKTKIVDGIYFDWIDDMDLRNELTTRVKLAKSKRIKTQKWMSEVLDISLTKIKQIENGSCKDFNAINNYINFLGENLLFR